MAKKRPHAISFDSKKGLTRQSFKDECDINNIIKTYTDTGLVNHVAKSRPIYGEAPETDFFTAACVRADIKSQQEAGAIDLDEVLEPQDTPEENVPPEAPEEPSEAPNTPPKDGA